MIELVADKNGSLKEEVIIGHSHFDDGVRYTKFNALGYDLLPPDLQEMYGKREDVVDNYLIESDEMLEKYNAFYSYIENDQGHNIWEEYRDAKGFGKQEEVTIGNAQYAETNDKPRETPSVDLGDETPILKK